MYKLGRHERSFNPRIPHFSALKAGLSNYIPPDSVDWTKGVTSWGTMLNDQLGDCTCAAWGHAVQVWTINTQASMLTISDSDIQVLYQQACGYNPNDPSTDRGGNEQKVLSYLANKGIAGTTLDAFVEVDVRNQEDIKQAIAEGGVCYIGFEVPGYLMRDLAEAGATWDIKGRAYGDIVGGHAVILVGYGEQGLKVISWGNVYTMTWAFFENYTDEAYMLASKEFLNSKNITPIGMTLAQLEDQMQAIREPPN